MLIPTYKIICILKKYNIIFQGALHIGAHDCEESRFYSEIGIEPKKIIWIDALQKKVDEARARAIPNVYQAVITDKDDQIVTFHVTNNVQSSSIFELGSHAINHPWIHFTEHLQLKTMTIDTFFKKNGLNMSTCEFWNFDIQGAEMLALKGARYALNYAKAIYLEINTEEVYKGCARLNEIDIFLKERGFHRFITEYTPYGWGDALYIRMNA